MHDKQPSLFVPLQGPANCSFALPLEDMENIQPIFVTILPEKLTNRNISIRGSLAYPIKRTLARALEVYASIEAVKAAALEICAGQ
ncbi:hypothetical protein N7535_001452 [Penicillium sp. DV-2018c]|nr:hypothetical protein N7461_005303 [Penicillium sp. DV-2018c]KAJ5582832.1 hypothetical protein N7535_001452 [Penicillium sp. DV-2018c]